MNNYQDDFVENLIFYRTQKDMSQLELSGICECAKSTISGIESKKNFPSFELIVKIAYALEIHPADLFLRNASQTRENVRDFFDKELSPKVKEMVEKRFPLSECDEGE
jgi:transcriptional regulator with XRE-family HTH domain